MRTSEEIYHRVRWDPRFDPERFVLGINQRGAEPERMPLPDFVPGGEIPWHRVQFVEADGELLWDRATGTDRIDASDAGRVHDPRHLREPFFAARTPYGWDPAASAWRPVDRTPRSASASASYPVPAQAPAPVAAALRVLTWNTLWDRYDSARISTARRRPLLLEALRDAAADVIALQEVERELLALLLRAPWVRAGYTLGSDPAGDDVEECGLLLLSRLPVREAGWHLLGRHKAVTAIAVDPAPRPPGAGTQDPGSGSLVVAATHLTSDHFGGGAERREAELVQLAEGLAEVHGDLILLGDFNVGEDGAAGPAAALGLRDAWTDVHGRGDRTPTFDPHVNPLAAVSSLSGRAARLDRILLRTGEGETPGWRVTAAALRGDAPAPEGLYVSDHYGVAADLSFAATAPAEPPGR